MSTNPSETFSRVQGSGQVREDIKEYLYERLGSSDKNRFPGPQPISIERKHFQILKHSEYLVCEKTDGVRHFLVCFSSGDKKVCALVNRSFDYICFPLTVPRGTILDGELIGNTYVIHDAMWIQGRDLRAAPLTERLAHARALTKVILPISKLKVTCKTMIPTERMSELVLDPKTTDGVVFTPVNEPVRMGTHRTLFKWKPFERITIDFQVARDGRTLCIQHDSRLVDVQRISDSYPPGSILECTFDTVKKVWCVHKVRTDKTHPNNKRTFERTLVNIREDITYDELVHRTQEDA